MGVAPTANMISTVAGPSPYDFGGDTLMDERGSNIYEDCEGFLFDAPDIFNLNDDPKENYAAPTREGIAIDPNLMSNLMSNPPQLDGMPVQSSTVSNDFGQAASSLVSPPASSHENLGGSPTEPTVTPSKSDTESRDDSPHHAGHYHRYTPESGPMRKASNTSTNGNFLEQHRREFEEHRLASHEQADEESLRLIKALQAQDLGLRRRGTSS